MGNIHLIIALIVLSSLFLYVVFRTRKQMIKLLAQNEFLNEAIDVLPVATFCKDATKDFQFILWNTKAAKMWGWGKKEVFGKTDYDLFPKEQSDYFRKKDIETVECGKTIIIDEEPIDTKSSGRRYLRTLKVPLYCKKSGLRYLLGISEDITDLKEAQNKATEQQLKAIAASKMASLGEVAAGLAHEINTPLAVIALKTAQIRELIQEKVIDVDAITEFSKTIETTTFQISKIIKGLRSFARDTENDPFQIVRLNSVIEDTIAFCAERFKSNNIKLDIQGVEPTMALECNSVQLSQVLLNLLSNSYDAIENLSTKWVKITVKDQGNFLELAITDSGAGVEMKIRDKLMQPFFTTKEIGKGTGLGLSISSGIITRHGGKLWLDENNANTSFVMTLPKRQETRNA